MSARLEALRTQFQAITDGINSIEKRAEGRDLSDAEQSDTDALFARAATLKPEIEAEAGKQDSLNAAAAVLARIQPKAYAAPAALAPYEASAGEYLSLYFRSRQGDTDASEMLTRTLGTQLIAGNPSIIPTNIIGTIIKLADDSRPVFGSFSSKPMPNSSKTFIRPHVTTRTNVGVQVNELDEATSRAMVLGSTTVTKSTYAGALKLSQQDLDWTDPAILQIVIDDFAGIYGNVTELAACTFLATTASASAGWTGTNVSTMVSSVTGGISAAYASSKRKPDTLWLDLATMLTLAGTLTTTFEYSVLTVLKNALADAGAPLNIVVGPQLSANTRILGNSTLIESYEQQKGLLSLQDVSHLGLDVAYHGYVAFYGKSEGFVKLV